MIFPCMEPQIALYGFSDQRVQPLANVQQNVEEVAEVVVETLAML